ncbi:MAG: DUF1566 domain-containing protein [Desulfamplus sp.]
MKKNQRKSVLIIAVCLIVLAGFALNAQIANAEQTTIVLTDANPDFTITTGTTATVYGTAGANHVTIESGADVRLVNFPGSNTITIKADSSNFTVSRSGAAVTFQGADSQESGAGGTVIKIPATRTAQTIIFNDTTSMLVIENGKVMLNSTEITTTAVQLGNDDDGELDTSFLELEQPGTYEVQSDLTLQNSVRILTTEARQKRDADQKARNSGKQTRAAEDIVLDEELSQIIITNPAAAYAVGDVLVLDDSSWKVTEISINGTATTLNVQSAELDEIVKDGSVSFNVTPNWSEGQFDGEDAYLLQKDAESYFTPSRKNRSLRALSGSDVDSEGAINLDDIYLFEFVTKYDSSTGNYVVDWTKSSLLGFYLDDEKPGCTGCCSKHGGVICNASGFNTCADEEPLSVKCQAKKCNKCPVNASVTKEGIIRGRITDGQIKIVPTIKGDYNLLNKTANSKMDMVVIFDATVEISSVGRVSFDFEELLLPKIKVPVNIGGVIMDIELEMPVKFSLDASVSGVATFEYHSSYAVKLDMEYENGSGSYKHKFDRVSEKKNVSLNIEGGIEAKLSLIPKATLRFYKVLGPFVELEPYIKGVLTKTLVSGVLDWKANEKDLYLGVLLRGGLSVIKLGNYRTPNIKLYDKSWDIVKPTTTPPDPVITTSKVPDTGVTKCYDNEKEIPCPSEGEDFYGQDGNYSINPMSYTKLDDNGNDLPITATSWAMVRDNVTGLIWENNSHNSTWDNAPNVIAELNNTKFGGYSDWRLPTIQELGGIVDFSVPYPGPTINISYFKDTFTSFYWSSTTYSHLTYGAWGVYFYYGDDGSRNKLSYYYVRAVRGGQSVIGLFDNLVINGNGTVTDSATGLMWQQDTSNNYMTWKEALSYYENLNLGGYTDWRLPTVKELRSIVDYSVHSPAIDISVFKDTIASFYWSSTTNSYYTYYAWGVSFYYGDARSYHKYSNGYVRAVRGGQ